MKSIKAIAPRALLVIMDGYGINPTSPLNAVKEAKKPNIDQLFSHYPYTEIKSGGVAVGLPEGTPGNSEVGHLNLGAGRRVLQDLVRINETVEKHALLEQTEMRAKVEAGEEVKPPGDVSINDPTDPNTRSKLREAVQMGTFNFSQKEREVLNQILKKEN